MKQPIGRFGFLIPERERRTALEIILMAGSCPMTRLWSSSSIRRSLTISFSSKR
jgi:hypothetical protein